MREISIWLDSQGATVILEPELLGEILTDTDDCSSDSDLSGTACQTQSKWGWVGTAGLPHGFAHSSAWSCNKDGASMKQIHSYCKTILHTLEAAVEHDRISFREEEARLAADERFPVNLLHVGNPVVVVVDEVIPV